MDDTNPTNGGSLSEPTYTTELPKPPRIYQVAILFIYHVALGIVLAYLVYNVWPPLPWPGDTQREATASATPAPSGTANTNNAQTPGGGATDNNNGNQIVRCKDPNCPPKFRVFKIDFQPTLEVRLILLVMLVGAIGSYLHAASSFVDYLGNRAFVSSWVWWYLLRPFIGMLLALLFYFVFRGGFITAGVNTSGEAATNYINPFGIAALAGLVGMFSKVATDKLNEVFTTLFRPAPGQGDAKRGDKLIPPTIINLSPNKGPSTGGTPVTITGTNFGSTVKVFFDKAAATSVSVSSATSLIAVTPAHDPGTVAVEIVNPGGQPVSTPDAFTYENLPPVPPTEQPSPPADQPPVDQPPPTPESPVLPPEAPPTPPGE
jgi:hypothetical protein